MLDIFDNYFLQREELLARIAHELQLDQTRLDRMQSAYNAVSELLKKDQEFFQNLVIEIYVQGSGRTMTTVKPLRNGEFDLDTVLHIYDPYYNHTPQEIYDALVAALEKDAYYKTIMEKKTRCVRLNYKGDFHLDILPACMPNSSERIAIKIPEKALKDWSSGNPKGFAEWFLARANSTLEESVLLRNAEDLIKAQIDTEPLPQELYEKTPLQRAVQLIKRYRDIYFEDKDFKVSSIVITTLAAQLYGGEISIFETIDKLVTRIKNEYLYAQKIGGRFKVLNPVNSEEDFTDSWTADHYESFFSFIKAFGEKWDSLKREFRFSKDDYIKLFGEGLYKEALNKQMMNFSKSTRDPISKASGIIAGGSPFTDTRGRINRSEGIRNEKYHDFGGNGEG